MLNFISQKDYMIDYLHNLMAGCDKGTLEHSLRVSKLCEGIALQLELLSNEIFNVYIAGLLHDVGKIFMTDIINQPGRLKAQERELINNHPQFGTQLLSVHWDNLPSEISEGIVLHHERLDGSGYPFNLTGHNIPLIARIVAVADVFDAMSNPRPYRPALSIQEIRLELSKSGYDQDVVQALRSYLQHC